MDRSGRIGLAGALALTACARAGSSGDDSLDTPPSVLEGGDAAADAAGPDSIATFRNPLDAGPDPFLTFWAGNYYLATTQGDALRMKRAASLAELAVAPAVTIWRDSEPTRDREVWAPAFYRLGDRWYVYYTADDGIDEHHRLHVLESDADDPLGPYHYRGELEPPGAAGLWAIDPAVFEQAGARYLVWSGAGAEGHNLLYISRLVDPATLGPRTYLPAAGGCPEVREAPAVLQHAGTTFLVYSSCDTGKPDYQLWMLSIAATADPLDAASWHQHPSPVFARDDAAGVWGPGSNGFFHSPDGTEDWIVFHAKNTSRFTYDLRTTRAQRITWVDGTPALGAPDAIGATHDLPAGDRGRGSYVINDDGTASGPGSVSFSAGWTSYPSCGVQCFMGDDHGTAQPGATAVFAFTGTQIALYSVRDAGNGIAAFSLDRGPETTGDFYASIRQGEQQNYASPHLPYGVHELRVTVTGARNPASSGPSISIDRAEVFTD